MVAKSRRPNFTRAYMLVKQLGHFITPLAHPAVPWWLFTGPWRLPGVKPHTCNYVIFVNGTNITLRKHNFTARCPLVDPNVITPWIITVLVTGANLGQCYLLIVFVTFDGSQHALEVCHIQWVSRRRNLHWRYRWCWCRERGWC